MKATAMTEAATGDLVISLRIPSAQLDARTVNELSTGVDRMVATYIKAEKERRRKERR